jgi:Rod binding domain-containing protein
MKLQHSTGATKHDQLVHQTQRLVSQTFFGTMLKQMRESPFKSEVFSGGRGGQMFSELLDQHLADHMARGTGSKLVNSIVDHIERSKNLKPVKHTHGINPYRSRRSVEKGVGHVQASLRA